MDLRSQPIRSKLLSLHLLLAVLQSHTCLFTRKSAILSQLIETNGNNESLHFIESIKEFLIVSLSRNATSNVPPVFDVSMEIFGCLLFNFRTFLKKETAIFLSEIVIPILEAKKNISWYQRYSMAYSLLKIFGRPEVDGGRILVELYINYDCDIEASAKENVWERLSNTLSKILSQHIDPSQGVQLAPIVSYANHNPNETPALTTTNLVQLTREQVRDLFSPVGEFLELKRIVLELLSRGILHQLAVWCDAKRDVKKETQEETKDDTEESRAEDASAADPKAFGNLKQKKQKILEGVKKFNIKPKKGIQFLLEHHCIDSKQPNDIAAFLLQTEGLSKAMIGEYLGEG